MAPHSFEYLANYGWVLITIIIIVGALVALQAYGPKFAKPTCTSLTTDIKFKNLFLNDSQLKIIFLNNTQDTINAYLKINGFENRTQGLNWKPKEEKEFTFENFAKPQNFQIVFSYYPISSSEISGLRQTFNCILS
jgi:hypothetical protein